MLLQLAVLLEQSANLILVVLEDLAALVVESFLDIVKLVAVVGTHLVELEFHRCDEEIDVVILVLQGVHILVILRF